MPCARRLTLLLSVALLAPAAAAHAATIRVAIAGDGGSGCTLRAAIADVNAGGGPRSPCGQASRGNNTVVLGRGSFALTEGDLVVDASAGQLTVIGSGESDTTVSGSGSSRVFEVATGATLALRDLTLSDGQAPRGVPGATASSVVDQGGGAIINAGTVVLADMAITDSNAGGGAAGSAGAGTPGGDGGAIENGGSLTLSGVMLVGDGAGIGGPGGSQANAGGSYPPGGPGGDGGGIANLGGSVTISGSTLTDDVAGSGGEGLAGSLVNATPGGAGGAGGYGGAIWTVGGTVSVTNSTLASNSAGLGGIGGADASNGSGGYGGAVSADGTAVVLLASDTIVANRAAVGGGIFAPVPANFPYTVDGVFTDNTLLAGNTGGNCAAPDLGDVGANLSFGDATCPATFLHSDPQLGALEDNGGPAATIAIGGGGAAAATGAGCPAHDQRGVPRLGRCDIGAYQSAQPAVVLGRTTATATAARIGLAVTLDSAAGTVTVHYGIGRHLTTVRSVGLGASVGTVPVTISLTGLRPGQAYGYTVAVTTSDGTASTSMRTLTTEVAPVIGALRVVSGAATYSDSEASTTALRVLRCVGPTAQPCSRVRPAATVTHRDRAGRNLIKLPALPAGQYELAVTPVFHGVGGSAAVSRFTVSH